MEKIVKSEDVVDTNDQLESLETSDENLNEVELNKVDQKDETPKERGFFSRILFKIKNDNNFAKKIFIITGIASLTIIVSAFFIFKIDGLFFPSYISGVVTDHNDRPLKDVLITINGRDKIYSNENGKFSLNLIYGEHNLTFQTDNFDVLTQKIDIKRGNNEIKVQLQPNTIGNLNLRLFDPEGEVDTKGMEVYFDGEKILVNERNEIFISNKKIGNYKLEIRTPKYFDYEDTVELKVGNNDLGELILSKAYDFKFKVTDWLNNVPLSQAKVLVNDIEKISSDDGVVELKDITTSTTKVKITFTKDGYLSQEINPNIIDILEQDNVVELVRAGKVVYVSNRLGNRNVYISNYDGSEEIMLSDNKGENFKPEIIPNTNNVRYLSTRDRVLAEYGNIIDIPYSVSMSGGKITKIAKSNYSDGDGIGEYNFMSSKRAFVNYTYNPSTDNSYYSLYVGPLDGSSSQQITASSYSVYNLKISNSGKYLAYSKYIGNDTQKEYLYNFSTKKISEIVNGNYQAVDFSIDDKYILYSKYQDESSDLYLYDIGAKSMKQITKNSVEEYEAQIFGNNIVYRSSRDSKLNIYMIGLDGKEVKLTNSNDVSEMWVHDNLVFYLSGTSLYVIDPQSDKHISKKVTDQVSSRYRSNGWMDM